MKLRLNNAMFWVRDEADFVRLKPLMSDQWVETYAEWLESANKMLAA
jgi:hypothetical protein